MKLWVDDQKDPEVLAPMFELDKEGWTWATTIEQAKALVLEGEIIEHLALDYQLGNGRYGTELAEWWREEYRKGHVMAPTTVTPISSLDEYNERLRAALAELM